MADPFVPALDLSSTLYVDVVEPLVRRWGHAAALLGGGSEVLGYDTERSTDHDWGPRLQLFVPEDAIDPVRRELDSHLPESHRGWPIRYARGGSGAAHQIEVCTLPQWLVGQLGVDPRDGLETLDWLTIPQQQILGVIRGRVFADPDGCLGALREQLDWYPHDVWLWLLACQWTRIGQEDHFVGRTAESGDDLGSRILAGRLSRDLMGLAFLQARRYRPYIKWAGTAFSELPGSAELRTLLERAVSATTFVAREDALVAAYEELARRQNALPVTAPQDPRVHEFFDRPFRVLATGEFAGACRAAISDPWLRSLPLVGSVDQFVDSTDVLSSPDRTRGLRAFLESLDPRARLSRRDR